MVWERITQDYQHVKELLALKNPDLAPVSAVDYWNSFYWIVSIKPTFRFHFLNIKLANPLIIHTVERLNLLLTLFYDRVINGCC